MVATHAVQGFNVIGNSVFLQTPQHAEAAYEHIVQSHPDHTSAIVGRHEEDLAYQVTAETALRIFHAELGIFEQFKCLRYPKLDGKAIPQNLAEFFDTFPTLKYFDQIPVISESLIKASPDMRKYKYRHDESASRTFTKNRPYDESDSFIAQHIEDIFKREKVSSDIFTPYVQELVDSCPKSGKAGILVQVLFPNNPSIYDAVYHSDSTGNLKGNSDNLTRGPLRILSSALFAKRNEIPMYRYSLVPPDDLRSYEDRVKTILQTIYDSHLQSTAELASLKERTLVEGAPENQQDQKENVIKSYFKKFDPDKAYSYILQSNLPPLVQQAHIIACCGQWLEKGECEKVQDALIHIPEEHPKRAALLGLLCESLLDYSLNVAKVDEYISHMPDGEAKNYALVCASTYMEEPLQSFYLQQRNMDYPIYLDELRDLLKNQVYQQ